MSESLIPFLRWAGSKRQSLSVLSAQWSSQYTRYVEPFAGSACLFFALRPSRAILGDINSDLVGTYLQIRRNPAELFEKLQKLPEGELEYYEIRRLDASSLSESEKAARFIYLNRYCFNGLYRTNRQGQFNVPYGGQHRNGQLPTLDYLLQAQKMLRRSKIVHGDFEQTIAQARRGDFVYMDPPYSVKNRRVFNAYDASSFSDEDLLRLRTSMDRLTANGIAFLVSYAQCPEANILGRDYLTRRIRVRRNIAGFSERRRNYGELLITNVPFVK